MPASDRLRDLQALVVDDHKDTREMLCFILQQARGHAIAVGSVAEALECYKSSPPDVIVSDIGMPGDNGYALIAQVRDHDKELGRHTPVIADQASIFDSFTRTQDAQAKGKIGWGLGLTLVRGSSEAYGGRVSVQSSSALGTTFIHHLPLDARPYQAA